jgi:hypothetical protein
MTRKQLTSTEESSLSRLIGRDFIRHRLQNLEKVFPALDLYGSYYDYTIGLEEEEEIIWNWVYEADSEWLAEQILENADKIIKKAGVVIIDLQTEVDVSDVYDTGVFIAFTGAGYNFYDSHWYPLFKIIYPDLDKWYKTFG